MEELEKKLLAGHFSALARLISLAENQDRRIWTILAKHYSKIGRAKIVGITGPPGAGKSTLIGRLVELVRTASERIGILAVDPISPFSQGALLGDRIRLTQHFNDSAVFIRSVSTRGVLGGLSTAAREAIHLMDLCGCEWIFVETVGVGQNEVEIRKIADMTAVVVVPESGDDIQTLKSGILEVADLFVINKSDRPGAMALATSLTELVSISKAATPIFSTNETAPESSQRLAQYLKEKLSDPEFLATQRKGRIQNEGQDLVESWVLHQTKEWLREINFKQTNPYEFVSDFAQSWKGFVPKP